MNQFWNERYAAKEYVYGTEPNQFLKSQLEKLSPGKILFPAEGEGRNAVYAAQLGWQVTAFDASVEAGKKAEKLARNKNVKINYQINDFENIEFSTESFDCIALVYAHMQSNKRNEYHQKLISFLKPGGSLILEAFSKKQINNNTGGPRNIEMLFSVEEMKSDFRNLDEINCWTEDILFDEGIFHQGNASVIRVLGKK